MGKQQLAQKLASLNRTFDRNNAAKYEALADWAHNKRAELLKTTNLDDDTIDLMVEIERTKLANQG